MVFYIYILQSLKDFSYYKGITENPIVRLQRHNDGESIYTSNKAPWQIVYLELHPLKREGLRREKALKKYSHTQIDRLIRSSKNQLVAFMNKIET